MLGTDFEEAERGEAKLNHHLTHAFGNKVQLYLKYFLFKNILK